MDVNQGTALIVSGGGFGDIWKGQMHNGGTVAIKAWRTNSLEQCEYKTIKRAARELFLWSRMDHPHIHRLQGVILFRDQYLGMVSEWMDNGNLHEYLRKHPDADRYELCAHVASGLEYMHSRNTANVLVSPDGVARLSDFDFSIMSEVSSLVFSESSNSRSGSIRWAAPEVLLSERPQRSTQSDVYALGMVRTMYQYGILANMPFLLSDNAGNKTLRSLFHPLTSYAQEIFTGDVPYPECRQDFTILKTIEKGVLPTRPLERIKEDQKGNEMWKLLLDCWNQNFSERPSSGQVVETLSDIVNRMDLDME
ncbi:unnamed protein product [Rhizoctonia solani]|uniref:Protein kinase domain-containing protein n=1 Tax=Rhizoctonia solani TaxID=456999 RepID=A0A8H3EAJ6_9AGAM|nr:unnamed protein product [Rhizoctonia solani]